MIKIALLAAAMAAVASAAREGKMMAVSDLTIDFTLFLTIFLTNLRLFKGSYSDRSIVFRTCGQQILRRPPTCGFQNERCGIGSVMRQVFSPIKASRSEPLEAPYSFLISVDFMYSVHQKTRSEVA